MPRSVHRLPGRSLLALALALPTLGLIAPAHAAGETTTLSGTVTLSNGADASSVDVRLFKLNPTSGTYQAVADSIAVSATGSWHSDPLLDPATGSDSYKVGFAKPGYLDAYYSDASALATATPVAVAAGNTAERTGINATLTPYVSVSGSVTDDNGTAVPGVQVVAHALAADASSGSSWVVVAPIGGTSNTTNSSGAWSYKLPPGSYEFEYRTAAYAGQYHQDAAFIDQGTSKALPAPGDALTPALTARLHQPATLIGTVKDGNGNPVAGATTTIQYAVAGAWKTATSAATSASGAWSAKVAPTTTTNPNYRVKISAPGFKDAYYVAPDTQASSDASRAKLLAGDVAAGATDDLRSATLVERTSQAGTIAGTIRGADGSIPTGGTLKVYTETITTDTSTGARHDVWALAESDPIGSSGSYSIDEPTGAYRIAFLQDNSAPVFYPSGQDLTTAASLNVATGQTAKANITLPRSGTVTGHVTYASLPVDAKVFAAAPYVSRIDNGVPSVSYATVAAPLPSNLTVGADATYGIALPAGDWVIGASDDSGHSGYFPNAASAAAAQAVKVVADGAVSDIDIEIAPAPGTLTHPTFTVDATISGTIGVGGTLTADPGIWLPVSVSGATYQWHATGSDGAVTAANAIPGATGQSYKLTAKEVGKRMAVTVTVTKAGLSTISSSPVTATVPSPTTATTTPGGGSGLGALLISLLGGTTTTYSPTVPAISPTASAPPVVSGTPAVGQLLIASNGTWPAVDASKLDYQWYADGQVIPGANTNRHVVTAADAGHALSVKVWFTNRGSNLTGSATSASTAKVGTPALTNQVAPSIAGNAVIGQTLTANAGTWTPTPTSFRYQWTADGVTIAGATASTYVVRSGDAGKRIAVSVTPFRSGYVTAPMTSPQTAAVPAPAPAGGGTGGNGSPQGAHKPIAVITIVRVTAQRHGRVVVVAQLSAPGARSFDGVFMVRVGSHRNSVVAHNGTVRIALSHLPQGRKLVRLVFRSSGTVLGATSFTWVKVKK